MDDSLVVCEIVIIAHIGKFSGKLFKFILFQFYIEIHKYDQIQRSTTNCEQICVIIYHKITQFYVVFNLGDLNSKLAAANRELDQNSTTLSKLRAIFQFLI